MAEGAEPKTSFAPSSRRSRFLDPETLATWKAKRRVRSQRLKSVIDCYGEPEARNRSNGAARGAGSHARWSQPGSEFPCGWANVSFWHIPDLRRTAALRPKRTSSTLHK